MRPAAVIPYLLILWHRIASYRIDGNNKVRSQNARYKSSESEINFPLSRLVFGSQSTRSFGLGCEN